MANEFIIVGDTDKFDGCLIATCGTSYERAESVLDRMKNNPTDNDKALCKGHRNLRIKEVPEEECWWNQYTD